jgi:soluble lytic murein transglycosylase-like protein
MNWFWGFLLLIAAANTQRRPLEETRPELSNWVDYYAGQYGVAAELVEAIIDEESGWNPYALSSKGAAGVMQLMPQTALRFGVHDRFRPEENIRGGVAYLAWLNQMFSGDLRLITAAYYVGEQPIRARGLAYSSPEVQAYVKRVARRYRCRRLLRAHLERAAARHSLR